MSRSRFALLLWVALGTGCAIGTQQHGRAIDPALIPQLKPGVSTKQDVLDLFGPPTTYSRIRGTFFNTANPDGSTAKAAGRQPVYLPIESKPAEDIFIYEHREEDESFFTVLLYTKFDRATRSDTLMVFFDTQDRVKYISFAKQTDAKPGDDGTNKTKN